MDEKQLQLFLAKKKLICGVISAVNAVRPHEIQVTDETITQAAHQLDSTQAASFSKLVEVCCDIRDFWDIGEVPIHPDAKMNNGDPSIRSVVITALDHAGMETDPHDLKCGGHG